MLRIICVGIKIVLTRQLIGLLEACGLFKELEQHFQPSVLVMYT